MPIFRTGFEVLDAIVKRGPVLSHVNSHIALLVEDSDQNFASVIRIHE
jgi:hypothetical protein